MRSAERERDSEREREVLIEEYNSKEQDKYSQIDFVKHTRTIQGDVKQVCTIFFNA